MSRNRKTIRVALVTRVCPSWRVPVFSRVAETSWLNLKVFHGEDVPGTKLVNAPDFADLCHETLRTVSIKVRSTGRDVPAVFQPAILHQLGRFRPDVLLCEGASNFFTNLLVVPWAQSRGIGTVWWSLGGIPGREYRGISRIYKSITDAMMRRATVLLGYSSRAIPFFRQSGCRQPSFYAVNCVDTDRVLENIHRNPENTTHVRRGRGLEGKRVVLFVGSLVAGKRVDELLLAFGQVQQRRSDVALVIVGDGPARDLLEEMARKLKLQNVYFAGQVVDHVSSYFAMADLFVLPGLGGLAISEAMCYQLPVICSVADGCEGDLVRNGYNGLIFEEGNVRGMSESMLSLLTDDLRRKEMGRASLRIIQTEHNIGSYVRTIVAAIECAFERRQSNSLG